MGPHSHRKAEQTRGDASTLEDLEDQSGAPCSRFRGAAPPKDPPDPPGREQGAEACPAIRLLRLLAAGPLTLREIQACVHGEREVAARPGGGRLVRHIRVPRSSPGHIHRALLALQRDGVVSAVEAHSVATRRVCTFWSPTALGMRRIHVALPEASRAA